MDERLHRICVRFRAARRALLWTVGSAIVLAVAASGAAALLLLDYRLHLPTAARLPMLIGYLAMVGALLWYALLRPLRGRWNDREVLAYLDELGQGDGMLLDSYELAAGAEVEEREDETGQAFVRRSLDALADQADAVRVEEALPRREARRWSLAGGAVLACFLLLAVILGEYSRIGLTRLFNPFASLRWPHRTTITLAEPEAGWLVPQGEAFDLAAMVSGEVPRRVTLDYRVADGVWLQEELRPDAEGRVAHRFASVMEPVEFQLVGGDYRTDLREIAVSQRPRLVEIVADYDYPDYAGVPDRQISSGQLTGLEGSEVAVQFTASVPLSRAEVTLHGEQSRDLTLETPTSFSMRLMLERSGSYEVRLTAADGLREGDPERYEIDVLPDLPPEVTLIEPAGDLEATARATVPVRFEASDDFGLAELVCEIRIDGGEWQPLSDRITGPLQVAGRRARFAFDWPLQRMDLPDRDQLGIELRVRARDVNPTGTGESTSSLRRIEVLRPTVFRERLFLAAKALLGEALIAERNQRESYLAGRRFLQDRELERDALAELWDECRDKQQVASRAADAMAEHLTSLAEQYEANRIGYEFMSVRLDRIARLLHDVRSQHHPAVAAALERARPRSAADAEPERLLKQRRAALEACSEQAVGQKMAVLLLQRMLYQLYDWQDLQGAALTCVRLHERQRDLAETTAAVAPRFIGKEREDLREADLDVLIDIGKRQLTLYEAETALEAQLQQLWFKAEQEKRSSFTPLRVAYKQLTDHRVNHLLKTAAAAIQNNQPADVGDDQQRAAENLALVASGLEKTGQMVEKLPPLSIDQPIRDLDPEKLKQKRDGEPEEAIDEEALLAEMREDHALRRMAQEGSDPLTEALNELADRLQYVDKRMAYLSENDGPEEMPRFRRLKLGILQRSQRQAQAQIASVGDLAREAGRDWLGGRMAVLDADCAALLRMLEAAAYGEREHLLAEHSRVGVRDLVRYLARQNAVDQLRDEHVEQGGVDAFERSYLLRDDELKRAVAIFRELDRSYLLLSAAARTAARNGGEAGKLADVTASCEREAVQRCSADLATVQQNLQRVGELRAEIGDAAAAGVDSAMAGLELDLVRTAPVALAEGDAELAVRLEQAAERVANTLARLRDLMDAVEAPEPEQPAVADGSTGGPAVEDIARMSVADYERLTAPEHLLERLQKPSGLDPALRESLSRSLQRPLPKRYDELLRAFAAACIDDAEAER